MPISNIDMIIMDNISTEYTISDNSEDPEDHTDHSDLWLSIFNPSMLITPYRKQFFCEQNIIFLFFSHYSLSNFKILTFWILKYINELNLLNFMCFCYFSLPFTQKSNHIFPTFNLSYFLFHLKYWLFEFANVSKKFDFSLSCFIQTTVWWSTSD